MTTWCHSHLITVHDTLSLCQFGEVGIDDALVMETKEEIFEMNNGCICCTGQGHVGPGGLQG